MKLSVEDQLKLLVPARLYYAHKINKEARRAEPELLMLDAIVPRGCTAIDVGANRGLYSYALSRIAGRVESFEPIPALSAFARKKLGGHVTVHEVALSDRAGEATFFIPVSDKGEPLHLGGNLRNSWPTPELIRLQVRVATLDSFGFTNVRFIKIDVEGSELDVIAGGAVTITRDRPILLVELVVDTHADPLIPIAEIERRFGYMSSIVVDGEWVDARHALAELRPNIKTNNVLFTPT